MSVTNLAAAACATLAILSVAAAQDPADDDRTAAAIARFAELDFRHKAAVTRAIERSLAALDRPAARRIAALRFEVDDLPAAAERPPIYSPQSSARAEHEAGRAPSRRVVAVDDPAFRKVAARFARPPFVPTLRADVHYDWASGAVVRDAPLGYDDLFANAAHGFAPGVDHAVARVLAALDRDPEQRKLGAWFAHTYCDLDARAFPPVSLYDAWYSGKVVDVPDVDAIPYAWEVLGWKTYRSPLSGRPRDRLYEAIRRGALTHRIHRTMCEAAAAAFALADPEMDPTYARLVPRFHYLWSTLDDDLDALGEKLDSAARDALLEEVDAAIRETDGAAFEVREARKRELQELEDQVRAVALAALERFGG